MISSYNASNNEISAEEYRLDSYINQSVNYVKAKLESKTLNVQIIGNGSTVIEQFPEAKSKITKNDQ